MIYCTQVVGKQSKKEAIFVEPLAANFEIFEQAHLKPTQSIVIVGDGKMGQLAAQVLTLSECEVMMVGKHQDKLTLAEKRGVRTYQLENANIFSLENGMRADVVVECSGSAQGLETALRLVRPRGTLILKSTVADKNTLHLAPIAIDEIYVQGSPCGPFAPSLRALSQKLVNASSLISACYTLDEGLAAFNCASQNGVLKVLVKVSWACVYYHMIVFGFFIQHLSSRTEVVSISSSNLLPMSQRPDLSRPLRSTADGRFNLLNIISGPYNVVWRDDSGLDPLMLFDKLIRQCIARIVGAQFCSLTFQSGDVSPSVWRDDSGPGPIMMFDFFIRQLVSRTALASCARFSGPYNVVWRDDSGLDPLQRVRCSPHHTLPD